VSEKRPELKLQVLVVWMPVVATDIAPPTRRVMALLSDSRVRQFWDERHLVSKSFIRAATVSPGWLKPEDRELREGDRVVWDFVALFFPGSRWDESLPSPEFYGYPVVDAVAELGKHLDRSR
jgi:hypothetical protein